MIPPISEMPVSATMRPTVRPTVAARVPSTPPPHTPTRHRCGNCAMADDCADRINIICRRDAVGFDNHPIPDQRFPTDRGPCIHHQYRRTAT